MDYYVVQLKTGKEEVFLKLAGKSFAGSDISFLWPRRVLNIKKLGKTKKTVSSIFPGYIFIETESITYEIYKNIKTLPGFCRFLKDNHDIRPLPHEEKKLISSLSSGGQIAGISKVYFNAEDRIVVSSGPMKGLEGHIIKVDKRKKRAKIKLKLYEDSFLIDFGFELIEHIPEEK